MKNLTNQQQETIKQLQDITLSKPAAIYHWINGQSKHDPIKQKIIAEYLGKSVEELFPSEQ